MALAKIEITVQLPDPILTTVEEDEYWVEKMDELLISIKKKIRDENIAIHEAKWEGL